MLADRIKLLDKQKNPFFKHSEMELFYCENNGEIIGRIGAIINYNHNNTFNDKIGFFGFFESINDQSVSDLLFQTAEQWLKTKGCTHIRGPVNPSLNDEAGLLIEGFNDSPQILMTYNPEYYILLIENFGFKKVKTLLAYRLMADKFISPKLERVQNLVRIREKITVRKIRLKPKKYFIEDVKIIKTIYNSAWEPNWGFVKMTDEEFDFLAEDLKQIVIDDFVVIAESEGKVVGFALGLPDINQAFKFNKGGSLIGAIYCLLFKKKNITRGRILVLGVLPEFQKRGIDSILYYEVGTAMTKKYPYSEGEASWILDDNILMNRSLEMMNGEVYKKYALYEKEI
ncbi:MAG: hypothetical protein IPP08_07850 [Chlorobiota bacterium]|nr:hypothetical protein [Chlorobiota bacterium]QQS67853.1 MAG: hypothetical protein IPP08_07850 [Chlorobiota bacterium]